ncbi:MAG: tRNA pseudouridine(13) synthase TruD [Phycisphaerales bacterium]|nr:tRNA pseudouridine(13) synthase TruD [Phycisphaerales bacterium]
MNSTNIEASRFRDEALPYLTSDLPGVGGVIKEADEDFVVEEVPLYEPSGEGTHVFFEIEKKGLTTRDAIARVCRSVGCQRRDVGYAGLKDARGVTRQVLSVEHVDPEKVLAASADRVRVLWAKRHQNKLKIGHLSGNRFVIRIRGMQADSFERAEAIVARLAARGMPNYFGPQRFGMRGTNALVGRAALLGDFERAINVLCGGPADDDSPGGKLARELFEQGDYAGSLKAWPGGHCTERALCRWMERGSLDWSKAWRSVDRAMRKLYVSAFQSELFNRVVAKRIERIGELMPGDLAWLHRNGACFAVEDLAAEQGRCDAFEISPSGPMFGKKMTQPKGEAAALEASVLEECGLELDGRFSGASDRPEGARRPIRVPVQGATCCEGEDSNGAYLELLFELPPGSFATSFVREVCK